MRPITITHKELDRAIPLTNENSEELLLRVGIDRYVIIEASSDTPWLAFESEEFSKLNNRIRPHHILGISTMGTLFKNQGHGDDDFEIIIHTCENGVFRTLGLSETGETYIITDLEIPKFSEVAMKAKDLFVTGSSGIGEKAIISPGLKKTLEPIVEKHGAEKVLKTMRKEALQLGDSIRDNHARQVDGKFCEYITTELRCGRVVFITRDDHSSMIDPLII